MIAARIQAMKMDGARRWCAKAEQGFDESRFARAVGTEEGNHLAIVDAQRHVVDRAKFAKGDFEMIDVNGGAHV
jgi:hypothetical protein